MRYVSQTASRPSPARPPSRWAATSPGMSPGAAQLEPSAAVGTGRPASKVSQAQNVTLGFLEALGLDKRNGIVTK